MEKLVTVRNLRNEDKCFPLFISLFCKSFRILCMISTLSFLH